MADNRHLNIILDLQDRASASLKGFKGRLDSLQPAFQKMAAVGTAAFVGIAAGVGVATKSAAEAEGSWNKFNTVFADGSDEMRKFIDDIRSEMPTATHEIARMAADLQDLLVPMGLARDDAQGLTRGFVDLANKLAAFNDVDPTQVLEAFKSGLAGSSEPLRRFGINALESSLELEAMNSGLLESGQTLKDLDPITRSQVKAQALLTLSVKQSSDAIAGFEANNDSFIRRAQSVKATMKELSVTLGNIFLPIIDDVTKKILPLIERVQDWVEENPKLARNIIIASAAIAGLVAVVGFLGMVLPAVIAGFTLLASPIGLIVIAVGALVALFFLFKERLMGIIDAIEEQTGIISSFKEIWNTLATFWRESLLPLMQSMWAILKQFAPVFQFIAKVVGGVLMVALRALVGIMGILIQNTVKVLEFFTKLGTFIVNGLVGHFQKIIDKIQAAIDKVKQLIASLGELGVVKNVGKAAKSILGALKNVFSVDDAIIAPNGNVITTHPDDYLIATKTPETLGQGGGGMTFVINGGIFGADAPEELANQIIDQLNLVTQT